MRNAKPLFAVGACLLAVTAAGCGGAERSPSDAVATVGDEKIARSEYDDALRLALGPDRDPKRNDAALERSVMESLINAEWVRQEAETRHISVTDTQVESVLAKATDTGFFSDERLKRAGMTHEQALDTIRDNQLEERLLEQFESVSRQDVADYYATHRSRFMVPERRDLRIVVAKRHAGAVAARSALEHGEGWDRVARRYSEHDPSRDRGGRISDFPKSDAYRGTEAAVFRAKEGVLVGPVKGKGSWAVFTVEKIKPPSHATLSDARAEIQDLLRTRRREQALDSFRRRYRAKTTCATGFVVSLCKNGPVG